MNLECRHCHQRIPINLQFFPGDRIEVECPFCHEFLGVDVKDIEKSGTEDTHPILRVSAKDIASDPRPKPPIPVAAPRPVAPPGRADARRFALAALLCCALFGAALVAYRWNRSTPVPATPETPSPESVEEGPETALATASRAPAKPATRPAPAAPGKRAPAAGEFSLSTAEIDRCYRTLRPSVFRGIKTPALQALRYPDGVTRDWSAKLAVILAYEGYRAGNRALLAIAERTVGLAGPRLKDPDYNLVQALLKLDRGDPVQAHRFAENAVALAAATPLAASLAQYAAWRANPGAPGALDRLRTIHQAQAFFPAGDLLLDAYAVDPRRSADAIDLARSLLRLEPSDAVIQGRLGAVFMGMKMHAEAQNIFEGLVRQDPASVGARIGLARALRKQGRWEPSRRVLDGLLKETDPASARDRSMEIQLERGWVDYDEKKYADAVRYFEVANRLQPRNLEVLGLLVSALQQSRREGTALALLESQRGSFLRDRGYLALLRGAQMQAKDYAKAERTIQEMAQLGMSDAPGFVFLGEIKEQAGDRRAALEAYQRALAMDPANAKARVKSAELAQAVPTPNP